MIAGEDVIGIDFDDAQLAQSLGTAGLAVILVEGTGWLAQIGPFVMPGLFVDPSAPPRGSCTPSRPVRS